MKNKNTGRRLATYSGVMKISSTTAPVTHIQRTAMNHSILRNSRGAESKLMYALLVNHAISEATQLLAGKTPNYSV